MSKKPIAWIDVIHEDEAEGRLAELYKSYAEPDGSVDNVLKVHSLQPRSLKTHFQFYALLMRLLPPHLRATSPAGAKFILTNVCR